MPSYPAGDRLSFEYVSVSHSDVFSELSALDTSKACGPDSICPRHLKEGAVELAKPLTALFNKSLTDGVLPLDWVSANITPVFKRGNKHLVCNYRPISLTCIAVKVLERIIFKKFYSLLESHQLWVSSVKYLGVVADSKLSWNDHVSYVSYKAKNILNLLHHHKYSCNISSKQKAFRSIVLPVLDYTSIVWNPHTQKNISVLKNIHNRAACWVCGSRYNPCTNTWSKSSCVCCSELRWPSLSTCRKFLSLITMYDMLHHHISLDFSNFFTLSSSQTRSHSLSILCKHSSINSYRYSFFVNCTYLFMELYYF